MKEYICIESPNEVDGGMLVRKCELIRCKDCKYYEIVELNQDGTPNKRCKPSVCTNGKYAVERPEDWYCGDAEPKEKR